MANKRIDDFSNGGSIQSTDLFLISRAGQNYSISGSALASGAGTVTSIAVASTTSDIAVTGSPITTSGTIGLTLANTGVIAGTYTSPTIVVDAKGRVTSITSGSTLGNTGVTPGTYTTATITVSADGRITAASNGTSTVPYDVGTYIAGSPNTSERVMLWVAPRNVTIDIANSTAVARTAGSVTFAIYKNEGIAGSLAFSSGTTGTFTGNKITMAKGEYLSVVAPAANTSLADIAITFSGTTP